MESNKILNNHLEVTSNRNNPRIENVIPNSKETNYYFGKIIALDRMILLLCIISLLLGELEFENKITLEVEYLPIRILIILMIISYFLVFLLVVKYIVTLRYYKIKKVISKKKFFLNVYENLEYIFYFVVLFSHSSPFLISKTFSYYSSILTTRIVYKVNSIFHFISLFKLLIIFKIFIFNTLWASDKSFRICRMYGCKNNFMFIIRCLMKEKPILFVFYTLVVGILFFGGAVRIVEGVYNLPDYELTKDHSNLLNCYWEVIITMTTVGYGDIFPITYPGRFIIVICSIFGITVVSLMVVSITNTLEMNNIENKSYIVLKKWIYKSKMEKHAGFMISILAKIIQTKKKIKVVSSKNIKENIKCENSIKRLKTSFTYHSSNFKFFRRVYKSIVDENVIEEIDRMNGILNEKLEIIKDLLLNPEEKNIKNIMNNKFNEKKIKRDQKRKNTKTSLIKSSFYNKIDKY